MNLDTDSELFAEVDRVLGRSHEAALEHDEPEHLRGYMHSEQLRAPYGPGDVRDAVAFIRDERGTPRPRPRARSRRWLVARAMRECEQRVARPHVRERVEEWRRSTFGDTAPPFRTSAPPFRGGGAAYPYAEVADWIEAEWRRYPAPAADEPWALLPYPGRRWRADVRIAPWWASAEAPHPLQRLQLVARVITQVVGCQVVEAVAYATTGVVPYVPPAVVYRDVRRPDGDGPVGALSIRVNFDWVPADVVRDLYQQARPPAASTSRTKGVEPKMRALRAFLRERPGQRWADLHDEWNRTHPGEWAYDKATSFREVGRRQLKALDQRQLKAPDQPNARLAGYPELE